MGEQIPSPCRLVLLYLPDIRHADHPITPFPAVIVEVDVDDRDPATGACNRVTLRALLPWNDSPNLGDDYHSLQPRRLRVVEGESKAWRWDWPPLWNSRPTK